MKKVATLFCAALAASVTATGASSASVSGISGDDTGYLTATKTAVTVGGTVICTAGNQVSIQVNVIQTSASVAAVAVGSTEITCTGQSQAWTVLASLFLGERMKAGPATLGFAANDTTDGTATPATFQKLKLK